MRTETPAKGIKGFLLYDHFGGKYFFRVYNEQDKSKYKDYKLSAEDIEIELISDFNSLYEGGHSANTLDYSSSVLGQKPNHKGDK